MAYIFATLKDIFPEKKTMTSTNLENLLFYRLNQIDPEEALLLSIKLNYYVSRPDNPLVDFADQQQLLKQFLPLKKWESLNHKFSKTTWQYLFFHRLPLLELMRFIILFNSKSSKSVETNEGKKNFIQALLIVNEIVLKRHYYPHAIPDLTQEERLSLIRNLAKLTETYSVLPKFTRGATLMLKYMPQVEAGFEEAFFNRTKLTLKEYFTCLFVVAYYYSQTGENTPFLRKSPAFHGIHSQIEKYLKLEARTMIEFNSMLKEQASEHILKPFRQYPILDLGDNNMVVLDTIFHTDKFSIGPLFLFDQKEITKYLTKFGDAFEQYTREIARELSRNLNFPYFKYDLNLKINKAKNKGQIDFAMANTSSLIIFEAKARWLKDVQGPDPLNGIDIQDLSSKYDSSQLPKVIDYLIAHPSQIEMDEESFNEIKVIYPVIVPYDTFLIIEGYPLYFEQKFTEEMNKLGCFQQKNKTFIKGHLVIAPLTILSTDLLEWLEVASKDQFQFIEALEAYTNYRNQDLKDSKKLLSFDQFIKTKMEGYSTRMTEVMRLRTGDLFEKIIRETLPEELANRIFSEE